MLWVCSTVRSFFHTVLKIVEINDEYIDSLREKYPNVMSSKKNIRKHTRKYLGVVLKIGEINYYVPFSSPKMRDFNKDGSVKKDNLFTIKILEVNENDTKLLGTLKLNDMIPVPLRFIENYQIENEKDENYKNVILAEQKWIMKNQEYICKKAEKIYKFKANENKYINKDNALGYQVILPFKDIEKYVEDRYFKNEKESTENKQD